MGAFKMSVVGFITCLVVSWFVYVTADDFNVNMENTGVCNTAEPVTVRQQDIYNIYAQPPQDGKGTRDRCTVKFIGEGGRKFKLFIREIVFGECQIFIKFYDGDMSLNRPRYQFGCESGSGGVYISYSSEIAISLEKPDAASTAYKFYMRLATHDGPDIGGNTGAATTGEDTMTAGVIAGVVVAAVLVAVVVVGISVYCVIVYRKKKEDKELIARSMSILSPSNASAVRDGGSSVHSSKHSTAASSNPAFTYPAYRTRPSISDKTPKCESIDTRSYDSENVDGAKDPKSVLGRNIEGEFTAMKKGLERQERRKEREKDDLRQHLLRQHEVRRDDRQGREESNKGFGRSHRSRDNQPILNAENIRSSLRGARQNARSFDEMDNRGHRSSRGAGSTRSSRSRNKSRERESRSDGDYYSDRERDGGRDRSRSNPGRSHRSSSANSTSRRKRDYYDERDAYSDYDDRRRPNRHDNRDRSDDYEHSSRRDSSSRSGTQRSRSQSAGRRQR